MTAYTLLNQIFYNSNKFDVEPKQCEKYMLLQEYVNSVKPINQSIPTIVPLEEPIEAAPIVPKLFQSKKKDQLFWNMYVLEQGESEYFMIGNKYRNVEIEEKKTIMDYVTKNSKHIKSQSQTNGFKITNVRVKTVESELLMGDKTSWYGFWIMCAYYKKNVLIVQNKVYLEFVVDSVYDTYLMERNDEGYVILDCVKLTSDKIHELKFNKLKIDPFQERILKGVSSYKIPDLEHMAQTLGVFPDKEKPKKNDYYEVVINKLVSMKLQN
jgi:hypothetical protein